MDPPQGADLDTFTLAYLACHEAECPACGYNLHALTVPRCPECGRGLALRLVGGRLHVCWIVLLIVAAFGAGIGVLMLAVLTRDPMPRELRWRIVLTYFMCNVPLPLVVLLTRRAFEKLPKPLQLVVAGIMIAATLVALIWFLAMIGR
jgi:hypothetical protein